MTDAEANLNLARTTVLVARARTEAALYDRDRAVQTLKGYDIASGLDWYDAARERFRRLRTAYSVAKRALEVAERALVLKAKEVPK